jgi:hypothetical protein
MKIHTKQSSDLMDFSLQISLLSDNHRLPHEQVKINDGKEEQKN